MVEVVFEPACLVTPDGPAGGAGGYRPEDVEVELGGPVGELQDAFDAGEVECGVELTEVAVERVTLGGGVGERGVSSLLVAVEVGEMSTGLGLESLGSRRGVGGRRRLRWLPR